MTEHVPEQSVAAAREQSKSRRFRTSYELDPHLGRPLEILTPGDQLEDADRLACFSRAAIALCALSHPGTPTLYAVSAEPPQLICGQLEGVTLSQVLDGLRAGDPPVLREFPLERLLTELSRLCSVLEHAHREGFVHRCIAADSVLLGGFGDVYLRDWWYAQVPDHYFHDAEPGSQLEFMRGLPDFSAFLSDAVADTRPSWLDAERCAPELKAAWRAEPAADVWCAGELLSAVLAAWHGSVEQAGGKHGDAELLLCSRAQDVAEEARKLPVAERIQTARALMQKLDDLLGEHQTEIQDRLRARAHRATGQLSLAEATLNPDMSFAARQHAVANLSRALALDPQDGAALRLMGKLFARTEDVLAGPAGQAFERRRVEEQASGSRAGAVAFVLAVVSQLALLLLFPQPLWVEVVALGLLAIAASSWIVLSSYLTQPRLAHRVGNLALMLLATSLFSLQFGPLIYVPAFTLACMVVAIVNLRPKGPLVAWALGLMLASILVPSVLMYLGVFPVSYLKSGQALVQRSGQAFAEGPTLLILAIGAGLMVVIPLALLGRAVDRLNQAERSLYSQAWLLRELIPDEASTDPRDRDASQVELAVAAAAHKEAQRSEES